MLKPHDKNPHYIEGFNAASKAVLYEDIVDELEDAWANAELYHFKSELRAYWFGWYSFCLTLQKNGV